MKGGHNRGNFCSVCSQKEYLEARLAAIEKATAIAHQEMTRRLETMNEFRDALKDQASRLATRDEVRLIMNPIESDLRDLRTYKATMEGKASQQAVNISLLMGMAGIIIGMISVAIALWK